MVAGTIAPMKCVSLCSVCSSQFWFATEIWHRLDFGDSGYLADGSTPRVFDSTAGELLAR